MLGEKSVKRTNTQDQHTLNEGTSLALENRISSRFPEPNLLAN